MSQTQPSDPPIDPKLYQASAILLEIVLESCAGSALSQTFLEDDDSP